MIDKILLSSGLMLVITSFILAAVAEYEGLDKDSWGHMFVSIVVFLWLASILTAIIFLFVCIWIC